MSLRHKSREFALQMMFQWEIGRQQPQRIEEGFWRIARAETSTRMFADELFEGAVVNAAELDALVAAQAKNWRPERMAVIDRAIMRLAAYEICTGKTPPKVVLDEAIEMAKTFSSEDAAGFINGILDALLHALPSAAEGGPPKLLPRPAPEPPPPPKEVPKPAPKKRARRAKRSESGH